MAHTIKFTCCHKKGNSLATVDSFPIKCNTENEMRAAAYGMLLGLVHKYRTALVFAHPEPKCPWVGYQISADDLYVRNCCLDASKGQFID